MNLNYRNNSIKVGGLQDDPDLKLVHRSFLNYHPKPFALEELRPDSVLTLRGPRRVGKTVSLKLLVNDALANQHFNPQEVVWTTFEALRTLDQIEERLIWIRDQFKPKLLVIDEVTAVIGWQQVVKKLKDSGLYRDTCMILTGSSAYDLKAGAERMAGRRGTIQHPDRVLFPMGFKEFWTQLHHHGISPDLPQGVQEFLGVGGYPFRVDAYLKSVLDKQRFDEFLGYQILDDAFFYEIHRRKLERNAAIEIVGRLSQIGTTAVSYEAFAKNLTLSRESAKRYLDVLGDCFLLATFCSFDTARGRVALKKDRKFAWVDPVWSGFAQWLGTGTSNPPTDRAEWAVGQHLLRQFELRLWEGLSAPRQVFTWKSRSGHEIDYLVIHVPKKIQFPVEVKIQNSISEWDFQVMEKSFGKGILVSLKDSRQRPLTQGIPLHEFLHSQTELRG
jgi:predicted AAA+ superfamily ATPase